MVHKKHYYGFPITRPVIIASARQQPTKRTTNSSTHEDAKDTSKVGGISSSTVLSTGRLCTGFAPGFSSAVDLQESLWLVKHYEAGVSTMLVRASHMARRSLRTKTPNYPPSPISQTRTNPGQPGPTSFTISEKLV